LSFESTVPAEGFSSSNGEQVSPRFTWYTIGLVGFFVLVAVLTRHTPQQNPRPFSVGVRFFELVIQWALFFVAYKGIRGSGLRFADVVGKRWSSFRELRKDLVLALIVIALIWIAAHLVSHYGAYRHYMTARARTGPQYVLTLLIAASAGVTEEIIFRGLLLRQFQLLIGNVAAAVAAQSFVFALAHGGSQSFAQFLKHCFSGCLFAYLAISRRSLWPAILAHVLLDVMAFTVMFFAR
jgi:membrane protease YdiL (CAAX protease family)